MNNDDIFGAADVNTMRLEFWRWKAELVLRILGHPAMQSGADCSFMPNFDSPTWERDFQSGMTVDQILERSNEVFNQYGW